MFFEYALEPTVISSWDQARFFLDAFGPWKGRFLAEYPRRWKKMVLQSLTCPDVEKHRIIERLARLDQNVFYTRAAAPYDQQLPWVENAEQEHRRAPFHAIIANGASKLPHILDCSDVDDRHDRWRVETGALVSKDPNIFAHALRLLLAASKRVVIIDPYFRADQPEKTRPLVAFCKLLSTTTAVEIHCSNETRSYQLCMHDAGRALPQLLPDATKVTVHCWKERIGGARFHNRFVLTDVGGVKFGDSIEQGASGHEDHLSILDEPSRLKLWTQYAGTVPAFEPAGGPREFIGKVVRGARP